MEEYQQLQRRNVSFSVPMFSVTSSSALTWQSTLMSLTMESLVSADYEYNRRLLTDNGCIGYHQFVQKPNLYFCTQRMLVAHLCWLQQLCGVAKT